MHSFHIRTGGTVCVLNNFKLLLLSRANTVLSVFGFIILSIRPSIQCGLFVVTNNGAHCKKKKIFISTIMLNDLSRATRQD